MVQQYKHIGATTDGYRGKRAIVTERVIEGFESPDFNGGVLYLDVESAQTQHLTTNNTAEGYYIILPEATTLWNNWQVCIINDSQVSVPVYYYTTDLDNLQLFKEIDPSNMSVVILLDNTTTEGTWTTLKTTDTISAEDLEKYTTDVYETVEIPYNNINSTGSNEAVIDLCTVPIGSSVKSIYIKPIEKFEGDTTLVVSIGTDQNNAQFFDSIDITGDISDTNFSKNVYDEIVSNSTETLLRAFISGSNLSALTAGKVRIIVERAREIDPTILKNAIVQMNMPIGTIVSYMFNDVPTGYFRLDGSVMNNANQVAPKFVEKLNQVNNQLVNTKLIIGSDEWTQTYNKYGSCGKFCWIGANLRFPAINCFIRGLSDLTKLGNFVDDTMRPITGRTHSPWSDDGPLCCMCSAEGALYVEQQYGNGADGGSGSRANIGIDSSRLGANYSGTETQPKHILYPYLISVFNKVQWESTADYNKLLEASVNKADRDLSNITLEGSNVISRTAVSGVFPDDTRGESRSHNVLYTATTYGIVYINSWAYDSTGHIYWNGNDLFQIFANHSNNNNGSTSTTTLLVKPGDTYQTTGNITIWHYWFYPCVGA